jgi:hypothetical protein
MSLPSKYKPEYCRQLIEHRAKGLSYESFGAIVEVCRDTLYEWEKHHKEWKEAKGIALSKARLWWDQLVVDHVVTTTDSDSHPVAGGTSRSRSLNGTVFRMTYINCFGYKDKLEVSGNERKPLTLNYALPNKHQSSDTSNDTAPGDSEDTNAGE